MGVAAPDHGPEGAEDTEINFRVAHPARIYDYLLGGEANFTVDREAAHRGSEVLAGGIESVRNHLRSQQAFLTEATRYLAGDAGIRQFLDIGAGIPNAGTDTVHAVAQQTAADSRTVYVNHDPIVLAHAHQLTGSTAEGAEGTAAYVHADLRQPDDVLEGAGETLDLARPVAIMLVGILHCIDDKHDPYAIVARLLDAVPCDSYLAVTHLASDIEAEETAEAFARVNETMTDKFALRSRDEVSRFLEELKPVEPGLVRLDRWRTVPAYPEGEIRAYAAVAHKP